MKNALEVREITAIDCYVVRHPILRVGRPIADCVFLGDDEESTLHLGTFLNDTLIGVCSAFQKKHTSLNAKLAYQIRGMAVLDAHQKKGVGKTLLLAMESKLALRAVDLIWLNARENARSFYQLLDYNCHGKPFEIKKIGTHYCYYKYIDHV